VEKFKRIKIIDFAISVNWWFSSSRESHKSDPDVRMPFWRTGLTVIPQTHRNEASQWSIRVAISLFQWANARIRATISCHWNNKEKWSLSLHPRDPPPIPFLSFPRLVVEPSPTDTRNSRPMAANRALCQIYDQSFDLDKARKFFTWKKGRSTVREYEGGV